MRESTDLKQECIDKIKDYPTAARSIHLNLEEFCEEDMPFPAMIAFAAMCAAKKMEYLILNMHKLQSTVETIKLRVASNKERNDGIFKLCNEVLLETKL